MTETETEMSKTLPREMGEEPLSSAINIHNAKVPVATPQAILTLERRMIRLNRFLGAFSPVVIAFCCGRLLNQLIKSAFTLSTIDWIILFAVIASSAVQIVISIFLAGLHIGLIRPCPDPPAPSP